MPVISIINAIIRTFTAERFQVPFPLSMITSVALLISISQWTAFDRAKDFSQDRNSNFRFFDTGSLCNSGNEKEYDYIVVGAGTAGMIVATRIANASENLSVLLLESGGEPSILNNIPCLDLSLAFIPANNFIYKTVPQKHACGLCTDRRVTSTRGRMLGGASQTNFMMYVRGNKEDFNRWSVEDTDGDPQWTYDALLPFFRKTEDYHGAHANENDAHIYHGSGGLLNIATYDYMPGLNELLSAAKEKGYKIGDYNGESQNVFSPLDITTRRGWRDSTYRAFYKNTGKPANLCIKKYAHVNKINFQWQESNGKPRASGVVYKRHGVIDEVKARKEIIVSAGVFESPKLLLLSGVGPKEQLNSHSIETVKDLPVGENLQDHVYTYSAPFILSPAFNANKDLTPRTVSNFLLKGSGPVAAPAGIAGNGFLQSPYAQPAYPDLQITQYSISAYPELPKDLSSVFGIRQTVLEDWLRPLSSLNTDIRAPLLSLNRPKSVGVLKLASSNPDDNLIIDPKYLEHPDDAEAMLYGFKKVIDLFENTKAINSSLYEKPVPGCEDVQFKSDEYFRCVIKQFSGSYYHHVGTCALGKVVDNQLKVKGIDGLRVADASVIPRTPNANTAAPTILIAEKCADLVIMEMQHKNP